MKFNRVRVGARYVYEPVMLDVIHSSDTGLEKGNLVKVINLPGAPPANTMGHCYVGHPKTGEFIGMVCVNSLRRMRKTARVQVASA